MMQIIDLFSGIAGFSLAGRWMGWETIQFVEKDTFCQQVIKHHFLGVPVHGDIKTLDFETVKKNINASRKSIIVGGFPCQPYSVAGKRKGNEDDRHLWPYCIKAVIELQPDFCVFENVPGLLNWSKGLVFEQVQTDLEAAGYEVQSFILPACGVDAPHKRERIWFVAYASCYSKPLPIFERGQNAACDVNFSRKNESKSTTNADNIIRGSKSQIGMCEKGTRGKSTGSGKNINGNPSSAGIINNTRSNGQPRKEYGEAQSGWITKKGIPNNWTDFPTQSPVCTGNDGISARLDFATVFEGIAKPRKPVSFGKWRNESIKAAGNAIVPQVAFQIFKAIEEFERIAS